ncbi:MAG TPA: GGDEF domain-containing protein [Gemmatimonadaceae bacterium]
MRLSTLDLDGRSKAFWTVTGVLLVAALGFIDYATGYELSFSLFYLIPITLVAWYSGSRLGFVISMLSAVAWMTADIASGHVYSVAGMYVWNMLIRLGFFVVITALLAALRTAHEHEQELARTDYLTGLANSRQFTELAEGELARSRRYGRVFTIAYLDLDDFKTVNDRFGHSRGDDVLRAVARRLRYTLRRTDVAGRLGGDEFVVLLPETSAEAARDVVAKLNDALLAEMELEQSLVTFSIGVVTFAAPPESADAMIKAADRLMYTAKVAGKGSVRYAIQSA